MSTLRFNKAKPVSGSVFTIEADTVNITGEVITSGVTTVGNLQTGVTSDNTIDTSSGDLILSSESGDVSLDANVTISGDLTIQGTTTTVESTVTTIEDPVITLGNSSTDDNKDRGIQFSWNDGSNAKTGFFGFDDSTNRFSFIPDATNTSESFSGTLGDAEFTNVYAVSIHGEIQDGSQTNITEVGTLTGGTWNASVITEAYGGTGVSDLSNLDIANLGTGTASENEILVADGAGGSNFQKISSSSIEDGTIPLSKLTSSALQEIESQAISLAIALG